MVARRGGIAKPERSELGLRLRGIDVDMNAISDTVQTLGSRGQPGSEWVASSYHACELVVTLTQQKRRGKRLL